MLRRGFVLFAEGLDAFTQNKVQKNKNKDPENVSTLAKKCVTSTQKQVQKNKKQVSAGNPQRGSKAHRSKSKLSHEQNICTVQKRPNFVRRFHIFPPDWGMLRRSR